MPSETLHAERTFLTPDSLDSIRTELEAYKYPSELGEDEEVTYHAGLYLSEEGNGHFCLYSHDLTRVRNAAEQIVGVLCNLIGAIEEVQDDKLRPANSGNALRAIDQLGDALSAGMIARHEGVEEKAGIAVEDEAPDDDGLLRALRAQAGLPWTGADEEDDNA